MKVTVTQDDIDHGCRTNGWECPVARALIRASGMPAAFVSIPEIRVWDTPFTRPHDDDQAGWDQIRDTTTKTWGTPETLRWKIQMFDITGIMRPFEFDL